ncbi:MAG: SCO family protein [Beijerinckiaceae bacterium]
MSALKFVRYGAWVSIAALGLLTAVVLLNPAKKPDEAAGGRIGGAFQLATAKGATLDSATLKGQPYGLFFGFTQCPDVCPGTLAEFTALMDKMDKGPVAAKAKAFRLLFVTVDPERDTPELLASYLSAFDTRVTGLIPTLEALPSLAKQFAAFYQKVPTSSGYTMNHTSAVYLFDGQGVFSGTIDIQEPMASRKTKLERLLRK